MSGEIPLLGGLSEIADNYDAFIIDIFGVVHNGIELFPDTIETFQSLKEAGIQTCLLSNSPRRINGAMGQMEIMGLPRDAYDHAVTSGESAYETLKDRGGDLGDDCWFIGNDYVSEITQGIGLNIVSEPEQASFILNSIPGTEKSEVKTLKAQLQIAADKDLPMICANPDLVVNIGAHQYECAGTFAALYEEMGGRVIYHGKPYAPVYERCHDLLGRPDKSKILAIGDAFHTDIAGANAFGIDSILNLTGIHWEEIAMDHAPTEADFPKLQKLIATKEHKPNFAMGGFRW